MKLIAKDMPLLTEGRIRIGNHQVVPKSVKIEAEIRSAVFIVAETVLHGDSIKILEPYKHYGKREDMLLYNMGFVFRGHEAGVRNIAVKEGFTSSADPNAHAAAFKGSERKDKAIARSFGDRIPYVVIQVWAIPDTELWDALRGMVLVNTP